MCPLVQAWPEPLVIMQQDMTGQGILVGYHATANELAQELKLSIPPMPDTDSPKVWEEPTKTGPGVCERRWRSMQHEDGQANGKIASYNMAVSKLTGTPGQKENADAEWHLRQRGK